jgi:predicted phage terminase large subunit-like protein
LPRVSPRAFDLSSFCTTLQEDLAPWLPEDLTNPDAALPWREWIEKFFPAVATHPFAERHERLWEWIDALTPGVRPRPRVEVWPRGGAKSSSIELGCARVCEKLSRRYVLYVCETQEQADQHVQSIASLLETRGIGRALNVYGSSKGWRRTQLRTANGFNVSSFGLDSATRGVKLDQYRPDLLVFDDIDNQKDTQRTVEKKINAITTSILPAGSSDAAVLVLQNKIHEDSIVSMLCDAERADFLRDREPACVEPAVRDLQTTLVDEGGAKVYRVTGGTATWAGQSLATCERQINDWGMRAFLREAQHEVENASGYVFNVKMLNYMVAEEVPANLRKCRAWDLAATEGGGDWTAGILLGTDAKRWFVLDVKRGQWASDNVRKQMLQTAQTDGKVKLHVPQDPGQAGKDQAQQFRTLLASFSPVIETVSGDKATRASGFAEAVNAGNVYLLKADWNGAFREELRKFREDLLDQVDDQVDAIADAYNELASKNRIQVVKW